MSHYSILVREISHQLFLMNYLTRRIIFGNLRYRQGPKYSYMSFNIYMNYPLQQMIFSLNRPTCFRQITYTP